MPEREPLLVANDLRVSLATRRGEVAVVRGVDLCAGDGETLGIAGESGCGKSTLAAALVRLLPCQGRISGSIMFRGKEVLDMDERALRALRGAQIAICFQNAAASFDPLMKIGAHLNEVRRLHRKERSGDVADQIESVGLDRDVATCYPHQLSGGMLRRAQLAVALAAAPALLIADEPTAGLDAPAQRSFLDLIRSLQARRSFSTILISHDLALIARACTRIAIMYAGLIVEEGPASLVLAQPRHPYTRMLADASRLEPGRSVPGHAPDPAEMPAGCGFVERCPRREQDCEARMPDFQSTPEGRRCRCIMSHA